MKVLFGIALRQTTGSHIGDTPVLPELLNQIPAHKQIRIAVLNGYTALGISVTETIG